jgi:hypothetical protein
MNGKDDRPLSMPLLSISLLLRLESFRRPCVLILQFLVPPCLFSVAEGYLLPNLIPSLIFPGDYEREIRYALSQAGIYNPDDYETKNSLFYCKYGETNDVSLEKVCRSACHNGGDGVIDYCDNIGPVSMPALLSDIPG